MLGEAFIKGADSQIFHVKAEIAVHRSVVQ
jgi:hypothetical protein